MNHNLQIYLDQFFREKLSTGNSTVSYSFVGGGCINNCYCVRVDKQPRYFLKINSANKYPAMFEKEKAGLELLASRNVILVPQVIHSDQFADQQILLLEWIQPGVRSDQLWKKFGEQIAKLHDHSWTDSEGHSLFGLQDDNYMGSLPQHNSPHQNWTLFFIDCRLKPQIELAVKNNLIPTRQIDAFENLYSRLDEIFEEENSSLLHGDLWSGNHMCNQDASPVLIDPAVYYGHRAVDLAMTTLFGGFDQSFYDAYNYYHPFPTNHREQWDVANLYPLLIHLNLFGRSYLSQIESILRRWSK